jgi:hypothetical protein
MPTTIQGMLGFGIRIAVAASWIVLWAIVLREFGIPVFGRSPDRREIHRQRALGMGQVRYVIVEGILGMGFAFGLAMVAGDFVSRPSDGWIRAVCRLLLFAIMFGWLVGYDGWVQLRGPVPFPPESLQKK